MMLIRRSKQMKNYKNAEISISTSPVISLRHCNAQYFSRLIMRYFGELKKNSTFVPSKTLNNWFSIHSMHLFFDTCTVKNVI